MLDRYGHLFPSLDEQLTDGLESTYEGECRRRRAAWPRPGRLVRLVDGNTRIR
jgi:hypothetical protein